MTQKKKRTRVNTWKGSRQTMSKGRFILMAIAGIAVIGLMLGAQLLAGGGEIEACPLRISEVMTATVFRCCLKTAQPRTGSRSRIRQGLR